MTNSINKIASLEKEDVEIIDDNSDIDGDIDVIDCSVEGNVPLVRSQKLSNDTYLYEIQYYIKF